ncbi:MAG: peptide chain release factor N(5)-glutamine methyltransferase [Acidimicrobiales bacterium]
MRDLLGATCAALGSAQESRWMVAHVAGLRAGDLVARSDVVVAPEVSDAVADMVQRRLSGEPLQYVLGTWDFRGVEVRVDPRVLIPRPETEQVVGVALEELLSPATGLAPGAPLVAADLGTGSGAIALALASELDPSRLFEVWATDISVGALELCTENLAALARHDPLAAARVRVARGSWFEALPAEVAGALHLVVSNPPYVSAAEWEVLEAGVRDYEPVGALVPGPTGLEAIEVLLEETPRWLAPGGSLVVELAPAQAEAVRRRATDLGFDRVEVRDDLAGRPRMLVARSSPR